MKKIVNSGINTLARCYESEICVYVDIYITKGTNHIVWHKLNYIKLTLRTQLCTKLIKEQKLYNYIKI